MCASSAYTILPLISVGKTSTEGKWNTGNPLVINKEWSNNSAGLIWTLNSWPTLSENTGNSLVINNIIR